MVSHLLLILVFMSHRNSKASIIINLSKKQCSSREGGVRKSKQNGSCPSWQKTRLTGYWQRVQQYVTITHVCAYECMHGYCGRQIKVWYPRYPCISISVNIIMISIVLVFTTLLSQCLYTAASPLQTEEKEHRCEDLWNIDLLVM